MSTKQIAVIPIAVGYQGNLLSSGMGRVDKKREPFFVRESVHFLPAIDMAFSLATGKILSGTVYSVRTAQRFFVLARCHESRHC